MKRWIKKHSKVFLIALSLLFIGNSIWWIVINQPGEDWRIVVHSIAIAFWLLILLIEVGAAAKLYDWWEKD